MTHTRLPRRLPRLVAPIALACLLAATLPAAAQAQAPAYFQNGQQDSFGRVSMDPYTTVGKAGAAIEARFAITDLDALSHAANVMVAFSLHAKEADITLDGVFGPDGKAIPPLRSGPADKGLQQQMFVAPAALAALAHDGEVDFVLRGHAVPMANGQVHLGAMVIAFDAAWGTVQGTDGPAQLYGFTLLMAQGLPGALHGQGNSWLVLPIAAVAVAAAAAGLAALMAILRVPTGLPSITGQARNGPVAVGAARPAPMPMPAQRPPTPAPPAPAPPRPATPGPIPVAASISMTVAARPPRPIPATFGSLTSPRAPAVLPPKPLLPKPTAASNPAAPANPATRPRTRPASPARPAARSALPAPGTRAGSRANPVRGVRRSTGALAREDLKN
jgi:hypothetical protein